MFNTSSITSASSSGEARPLKLEGDARVLWHCWHTPRLPAALRFREETLHGAVAGVTQAADARALPCTALAAFLGRCSSAELDRKANAGERRRETKLRACEPFPCADPGSPKVEPVVRAQGRFCRRGRLYPPHPAVPCPAPRPVPLRARGRGSGRGAVGGMGTDAWGVFHLMMKRELKTAFAFLKTQDWRRNSKYAVNRNS